MPFKKDVDSSGTNTDVATRKYSSPETPEIVRDEDAVSNAEHLIDQAAGLKAMSLVADKAATLARKNLDAARVTITTGRRAETDRDTRPADPVYTENDVSIARKNNSKDIFEMFGLSAGHEADRLHRASDDVLAHSLNTFLPIKEIPKTHTSSHNSVVPEIESVRVDMNKKKGTTDCFFTRVRFNIPRIPVQSGKIKAIRVFRSVLLNKDLLQGRNLSIHAIEKIRPNKNRTRTKNFDTSSDLELRLSQSGIENSITKLNPIDPMLGKRIASSISDQRLRPTIPVGTSEVAKDQNRENLAPYLDSEALVYVDPSVLKDLKSLRNIQLQNPHLIARKDFADTNVGRFASRNIHPSVSTLQMSQANESRGISSNLIVDQNNKSKFREIAFLAPDKINSEVIGNEIEYTFEDQSVSFGHTYSYYIVTVDENLRESVRSRIVEVDIDGLRVPANPKRLQGTVVNDAVALSIVVDDQLVEKFEIWRKEVGSARLSTKESRIVSGKSGFTFNREVRNVQPNRFLLIGESVNGDQGGSMFYDRRVVPGQSYVYRVYSVDIFGNKSESPKEITMYIRDKQLKPLDFRKPTLLAELDSKTHKVKLTFECDDPRIESFFLERRDLTLKQSTYAPPGQVSRIKLGDPKNGEGTQKFEGERIVAYSKDVAWTGHFQNEFQAHTFVDRLVAYDHTYQYRLFGIDRFGNKTPYEISRPIFIARKPLIESPVNLSSHLQFDANGAPRGVYLKWQDGNLDVSAEQKFGSQEALRDNSVKTLFQVERRKIGEERWLEFPLIERNEFFDPIRDDENKEHQNFRPEFLEINQRYIYRVEAIQSGGFVSNFSRPIEVFTGSPVLPPTNFRTKAADSKVRPFYVMLNWNTDARSGVVDRWEIERADVNNFAAARLNTRNPLEFQNLSWRPFRTVYREASRFRAESLDVALSGRLPFRRTIIGEHHFMDNAVQFGNTYFYRIRAITPDGEISPWVMKGMKVTDEVFERKQLQLLSAEERERLSTEYAPMKVKLFGTESRELVKNSISLQPGFSNPVKLSDESLGTDSDSLSASEREERRISVGSRLYGRKIGF